MKIHTTNYQNAFIVVADDCPALCGEVPPVKPGALSVANLQFDLVARNPYKFTSDDVLFQVHSVRNDLTGKEFKEARKVFFSKGQPCFRASPLTKRYGWGIHFNQEGKMALYACEAKEYKKFTQDKSLKIIKAMKSAR